MNTYRNGYVFRANGMHNIYQGKASVHYDDGTVKHLLFKNGKPVDEISNDFYKNVLCKQREDSD